MLSSVSTIMARIPGRMTFLVMARGGDKIVPVVEMVNPAAVFNTSKRLEANQPLKESLPETSSISGGIDNDSS